MKHEHVFMLILTPVIGLLLAFFQTEIIGITMDTHLMLFNSIFALVLSGFISWLYLFIRMRLVR